MKNFLKRILRHENYDYKAAVGGDWERIGKLQFEFLISEGLKPEHFLFDVACGSFRAGQFFINYLPPSHYYGIDANAELMKEGKQKVLRAQGLLNKEPWLEHVCLTADPLDFFKLTGRKFDYIWIHALFDHIHPEITRRLLLDLESVIKPDGRLYATIFLNSLGSDHTKPIVHLRNGSTTDAITTYPDREYWHHTLGFFESIAKESQFLLFDACIDEYLHPLELKILKFLHRERKQ